MTTPKLILGAAVAVGLCAPVAQAEEAILAHIMDSQHIFDHVSQRFMTRLDELSDGTFNIEYHPGGDLGDWTSITEQVAQGAIEMTISYNHSELDPRWDITALGFIADDWESGREIYGPDSVMSGIYSEIVQGLNMELLGIIPTDFTGFIVREGIDVPLNFPEDAKGFKMRVPGWPMAIKRYTALGFSPVPMAFSEVYTALQTGGIDGRAYGPPSEVLMFEDVISSYVFTREGFEHTFWVANKAWLDGLSDEQQDWVRTAAAEASAWAWETAEAESAVWLDKIRDAGIDVVELSPESLAEYRELVIDVEYPYMEGIIGKPTMDKIKEAAGVN